jgi:hypothetical protein
VYQQEARTAAEASKSTDLEIERRAEAAGKAEKQRARVLAENAARAAEQRAYFGRHVAAVREATACLTRSFCDDCQYTAAADAAESLARWNALSLGPDSAPAPLPSSLSESFRVAIAANPSSSDAALYSEALSQGPRPPGWAPEQPAASSELWSTVTGKRKGAWPPEGFREVVVMTPSQTSPLTDPVMKEAIQRMQNSSKTSGQMGGLAPGSLPKSAPAAEAPAPFVERYTDLTGTPCVRVRDALVPWARSGDPTAQAEYALCALGRVRARVRPIRTWSLVIEEKAVP